MEKLAKPLAILALVLTIGPPAWMFVDGLSAGRAREAAHEATAAESADPDSAADSGLTTDSRMKLLMAVGAVLWFATAPFWLKEDKPAEEIIERPGLQGVP
jgi:hypothetical protein